MNDLPEGVSVIIAYKEHWGHELHRTRKLSQNFTVQRACRILSTTCREFRVYPISSKTKYTKVPTELAWDEGMTLEEFKEYLNG